MPYALLIAAVGTLGCSPGEEADADTDVDLDVDTDTDGDTDSDTDDGQCLRGETLCDGECVNLLSDESHCGVCGNECPAPPDPQGWTCFEGECSCTRTGAAEACDGTPTSTCCVVAGGTQCVDISSSDDHCGNCTRSCAYMGASPAYDHCEDSECVCGDLGEPCDGAISSTCCMDDEEGTNARCANLLSDESDCGECGAVCQPPRGDRCRNGQCVCGPGTAEVPSVPCPEAQECCTRGGETLCVARGSCM